MRERSRAMHGFFLLSIEGILPRWQDSRRKTFAAGSGG